MKARLHRPQTPLVTARAYRKYRIVVEVTIAFSLPCLMPGERIRPRVRGVCFVKHLGFRTLGWWKLANCENNSQTLSNLLALPHSSGRNSIVGVLAKIKTVY